MLTSGILSTIGTMTAHSFLLDGQGFPFMAEYCFYYIAGCHDLALSCVTIEDTTENVRRILSEFLKIEIASELKCFEHTEQLLELMDSSGCDQLLTVGNKEAIAHCIILYDAFHKRRLHLDALAAGLEVLGLKKLFSQFPQVCKPILVSSGVLEGKGVRSLLRPEPEENDMNTDELRVWKYLLCFIDNASEEDLKGFLQFVTGSVHVVGNIAVNFDSERSEAIAASTCRKLLTLSSKISDQELFVSAIGALGKEISYTML